VWTLKVNAANECLQSSPEATIDLYSSDQHTLAFVFSLGSTEKVKQQLTLKLFHENLLRSGEIIF